MNELKINPNIILIRKETGCPYMVIKKALWASNDDVEQAIDLLRRKYYIGDYPKVYIQDWEIEYDNRNLIGDKYEGYEYLVQPRR